MPASYGLTYDWNHMSIFRLNLPLDKRNIMNRDNNTSESDVATVAQLAIAHPAAAAIFEKYNIDYCCGGHRTLEEACERMGLDPAEVEQEIRNSKIEDVGHVLRTDSWSASLLVDFIVQNHHAYVNDAIPLIKALLEKVCSVHGNDSLELLTIREDFLDLADELTSHMQKEEFVLFPAIKRLESQSLVDHPLVHAIQSPISAMEHEHTIAGDLVKHIRALSNNYTPPSFACPTFRTTYERLREFDNDLMRHIHLENNVLFERMKTIGSSR